MSVSCEGEAAVTGAGDETLSLSLSLFSYWNVFNKVHSQKVTAQFIHWGKIFLMDHII
jgi:hypothetical protein